MNKPQPVRINKKGLPAQIEAYFKDNPDAQLTTTQLAELFPGKLYTRKYALGKLKKMGKLELVHVWKRP